MKLTAFRIRNYRSVVDTGWVNLSPDNITTLIGQNESGKTSVLEALYSFYTGIIHEDILRSDLSLPYISCSFTTDTPFLGSILNASVIKTEIYNDIMSSGKIYINRKWIDQNNSVIFYGNDKLIKSIEEEIQRENQYITELEETVHIILEETEKTNSDYRKLKDELSGMKNELNVLQKKETRLSRLKERSNNEDKKDKLNKEFLIVKDQCKELKDKYTSHENKRNTLQIRLDELISASKYAELFLASGHNYKESENILEDLKGRLQNKQLELRFCTDEKKSVLLKYDIKKLNSQITSRSNKLKKDKGAFQFRTECLSLALSEKTSGGFEEIATKTQQEKERLISMEDLGQILFRYIPSFKLFEDFSSLLPNRIDLDDILNSDTSVEGYNAVRNFLIVSGLDATFFTEQNNRILKQKIENLNGEITLHFQDYWRQSLGRNNKIKINFELEHYDFSHPAKKGKPYLEFWIKDEHERLYPKQRSRGVRWFLSFYLELKATSLKNKSAHNILLIDEPGLSLHARAQEDVLKVFEDMKDNIQILYSTHSPHLVNISKLYRILAIQRADEYNDKSESLIFDVQSLGNASGDTLSPIYSLIGTKLSESNFIQERNNLIIEDLHIFYYLKNIFKIFAKEKGLYFLPANGIENIPILVNMMIGWNLHYSVLLFGSHKSESVYNNLREVVFKGDKKLIEKKVLIIRDLNGIEDVFSTLDFKKHILQKRVGITESNTEYIENNKLSRKDLAAAFSLRCQDQHPDPDAFDEETRENMQKLISEILRIIKN